MTNPRKNRTPHPDEILIDAIRDNLSPEAVATIIAYLQPARANDEKVTAEVRWFATQLGEMLGADEFNRLANDLGL